MANDYCNSLKMRQQKRAEQTNTELKETTKKHAKVVEGEVKRKKKSEFQKFKESIIGNDETSLKRYVIDEIVKPTAQRMFVDVIDSFNDAILDNLQISIFGAPLNTRGRSRSRRRGSSFDYRGASERGRRSDRDYDRFSSRRRSDSRSVYDFEDVVFAKRSEAQLVLDNMLDVIEDGGLVTVGELYEFAGFVPENTDYNYGWTSLRNARIVTDRDGFRLDLPYIKPID